MLLLHWLAGRDIHNQPACMHASDPPENDALRDLPSVVGQLLLLLLFYFIYLFIYLLFVWLVEE
jgi:hypothetical protein